MVEMSVHFVRFYSGFDSEVPLFESFSEVSLEISKVYSKKIARFSVDFMLILHTAISYLLLWNICCLEIFFFHSFESSSCKILVAVSFCSMEYYMQKTYYKTASLISNSCKAIALLAGQTAEVSILAYEYGKNLVCILTYCISCAFLNLGLICQFFWICCRPLNGQKF